MTAPDQGTEAVVAHRPFRLSNIRHWSMREWGAILIVAGFLFVLAIIGAPSTGEKQMLRTQFHLPGDVALTEVHIDRSSAKPFPAPVEGLVRFTDAQFHQYVARLGDKSIWKPVPMSFGGAEFHGPYAADALVWRDLNGARQLGWGSLSWKQAQNARHGVLLCFAVREDGNSAAFRGEPCPPPNSPIVKGVYAQGLLDFETKELHMLIRRTRPQYRG